MNMITRSSQKIQSRSGIPHSTAYVMPSYTFHLVAGNSKNIRNVFLNGEGAREPEELFMQVCNLLRKKAGHPPLECIFFNPAKEKDFEKQKGEKFSFIRSQGTVPKSIEEHSKGGYLVSPELSRVIESKVNTARAGEILNDPEKRKEAIQDFLTLKKMNKVQIIQKLNAAVVRSLIPTGVIKSEGYEDTTQQIKKLLEEYKDIGIVIQTNRGTGGQGTALFKPEKVHEILNDPKSNILKIVIQTMGYGTDDNSDFKELFLKGMQKNHFSWQKMVSGKEACVMLRTNSEKRQIEMSAVSTKFMSEEGKHLGNTIISMEDIQLNEEQKKYFMLSNELMLHTILKLNGYKKGINEIYDADGSHLKAFSNDTFFSVADDGSIKHEISEFNGRPPSSAYAVISAESIGVSPPFSRLFTGDVTMSKGVFEHLQKLGVEKASDFFSKKFTPILEKFKGAFIDTFSVENHSKQKDEKDHFSYSWSIFYPHPDMENKGQEELKAKEEIHEICKNITVDDINETLSLRRSKRLKTR